jgi:hypothetical protein
MERHPKTKQSTVIMKRGARGAGSFVVFSCCAAALGVATAAGQGVSRPPNDDFAQRTILTGEVNAVTIDQTNATVEVGEPRLFPQSAGKSVWWQWTPPRTARASFVVVPTNGLVSLFSGSQIEALVLLTNRAGSVVAQVSTGAACQIDIDCVSNELTGASLTIALNDLEIAYPPRGQVFHAPASWTLRAQRTAEVRDLAAVEVSASGVSLGQLPLPSYELLCSLTNCGYYNLQLAATDNQGITTLSDPVPVVVRPANDDFDCAQLIGGRAVQIHASSLAATLQATNVPPWPGRQGEPTWGDNQGGHSIWYQWTAPADGMCVIDGAGQSFPLLFNVCLGTKVNSLSVVAANPFQLPYDPLEFDAVAGQTYRISVDGLFGEEGPLDWSLHLKPYNDDFADRRLLTGLDSEFLDCNDGATTEAGEAPLLPSGGGSSLWYSWPARIAGDVVVTLSGTNPLAVVVFTGENLSGLIPVSPTPAQWTNAPTARFTAEAGVTYQIAVFGIGDTAGSFTFQLAWQGLRLVSPLPNSVMSVPATLHLAAQLTVSGKSLSQTTFKVNGADIGAPVGPPFVMDWNAPGAGTYTLQAHGVASDGTAYDSLPSTCLVYAGRRLPRPRVFSGISSGSSYVINAVGALYVFGDYPEQFGRTAADQPSTPFLASWPPGVTGWKEISGPWAINDAGQLYQDGQTLIPFPAGVTEWRNVSLGFGGVLTVGNDGNLYLSGGWPIPVPQPPGGWREARASLANGNNVILALGEDKEAYIVDAYQWNVQHLDRPAGVTAWQDIALAALFGVLLSDNGELYIYGMVGDVTGFNGTPGWSHVTRPAGVTRWVDFAAGGFHVLAIGDNAQLYAWGRNWELQLGLGLDQNPRATPTLVAPPPGVTGWSSVAAGKFHSLAIGHDCSVYAWGQNDGGQTGQPASAPLSRPVRVASLEALCGSPVLFTDGNASRLPDGTFRLEFNTDLNRSYLVQYSDDLRTWAYASQAVRGTGDLVEWNDDGPPKTNPHPGLVPTRVYRVVFAP